MQTAANDSHQQELLIIQSVEIVFRKLVRFVVDRVSLVKLQESFQRICVEECERSLQKKNQDQVVSVDDLTMRTGIDSRTLSDMRNSAAYFDSVRMQNDSIQKKLPEHCVLDIWSSSPEYLDPLTGSPKKLPLHGEGSSFDKLVTEAIPWRDVSAQSMLASLVNNLAVKLDDTNLHVELLKNTPSPYSAGNHWGVFEFGMFQVCGLLDTILHNFQVLTRGGKSFYDRGCWTHRLSPSRRLEFREQMRSFLASSGEAVWTEIANYEDKAYQRDQLTAGVFMYYFEQEQ